MPEQNQHFAIVNVHSEQDIRNALAFAKEQNLKVSLAGQQHSMGGQTFIRDGLVLDMKQFNAISIDREQKVMRVQAGALWSDVQQKLDPLGLSVEAMQSINIFTVGGTLSVNAHGIAHNPGQVAPTVRSLRIMKSDGEIVTASHTENKELFRHALGGYGLFGVILEAEIDVIENELYAREERSMAYSEFQDFYEKNIQDNPDYGLFFARLSVAPHSYLQEVITHAFKKTNADIEIPLMQPEKNIWLKRLVINLSKTGNWGRSIRWFLEKNVDPKIRTCIKSRNELMSKTEDCIVPRNQAMYDSMQYLQNRLKDTDILQEYFIPKEHFVEFVDGLRTIVQEENANLLNVTIRIVHSDTDTAMPYATEDNTFAFVLYFNQKLNTKESERLERVTKRLISLADELNGRFYLPYQLYYDLKTLRSVYPETTSFFAQKRVFDSDERFSNKWYEKYRTTSTQ